jgi:UDP-N-acetylglucosamine--N-acetylmuramyl-(pentapeptide) pyrophosphoryl-undecaprenol N-acetylglucosamine transferase
MRVLCVGGGSGGHLTPIVAVCRALRKKDASIQIHIVCTQRPVDSAYLNGEREKFSTVTVPRRAWQVPWTWWKMRREANVIIERERPNVIFSKGGLVSLPICAVARARKIPIVLHESDTVMGRANRFLMPWATIICRGFAPEKPEANVEVTGNPVRPEVTQGNREKGLSITGLSGTKPILLVCGGSQGAQAINMAVRTLIGPLLQRMDVVHLTGRGKEGAAAQTGYWSAPFVVEELPHLYAIADYAVTRAGTNALAELAANEIPSIVVPLRGLAQDHQWHNAKRMAEVGGCILLEQEELESQLLSVLDRLLANPGTSAEMAAHMRQQGVPDAAGRIAEILVSCVARRAEAA